jgi:hypothetical protein
LRFGGNFVPIDDGIDIRSFEALGEFGGFFVVEASSEMGVGLAVSFVLSRSLSS